MSAVKHAPSDLVRAVAAMLDVPAAYNPGYAMAAREGLLRLSWGAHEVMAWTCPIRGTVGKMSRDGGRTWSDEQVIGAV
ncbi:MAG: hypothetical protein IPL79_20010 [Myxococcales bacterium]|nr:hypothetical protein [Myxococcales bacterium]